MTTTVVEFQYDKVVTHGLPKVCKTTQKNTKCEFSIATLYANT